MRHILTYLLFCLACSFGMAQGSYKAEEFKSALMQTKEGAMVVYTGDKHSFTININGKVTPSDQPNFVTVNGNILQSSIIPFQTQIDFENLSIETQKKNLQAYMDYELKYIKEQLQADDLHEKSEFITLGGKTFLYWSYDIPKSNKSIDKQCYLVAICFDHMLVLNAPVIKGTKYQKIKDLLTDVGETLKLNNSTIDLEQLYNQLNGK